MLQSLKVKNLALMEETEVEFGSGLNILTGETGAGKSLLIGSVNLALGGKFEKEMLRRGAENAYVELVFTDKGERLSEKLKSMDIEEDEDGTVIISRRMQPGKSVCKVNGETVTAKQVKELAEDLLDIHGQYEHQSLLHAKKHLEILDDYCGEGARAAKAEVEKLWQECRKLRQSLSEEEMDEKTKERERMLAEFEYREIAEAELVAGEDEELERQYRMMANGKKIMEALSESYQYTGSDAGSGASSALSRALRAMRGVVTYDGRLEDLERQLAEVDNLLSDYNRDVSEYMSGFEFDGQDFCRVQERLGTINRLKEKYGNTIEEVLAYQESRQQLLEKLSDYDAYIGRMQAQLANFQEKLEEACGQLSAIRQRNAGRLTELLKEALVNLNFLAVEFEISVRRTQINANGYDEAEFLISTNPGESLKPLSCVASGGELSRVMLAIKTVLSGKDRIDTLIFDEIDAGISGLTAWRVSEQLGRLGKAHQVICITHLPQIAAMADAHFVIAKSSTDGSTVTDIRKAGEEESLRELARLLGSDILTEEALANARQMRGQALAHKTS